MEIKTIITFFIHSNAREHLCCVLALKVEKWLLFHSFQCKGALVLKIKTLITFSFIFSTARRWPHSSWDCWCGNNRCFKNWLNQSWNWISFTTIVICFMTEFKLLWLKKKEICFAGYVLRLCPFEDVAMVGLAADDVEAFLQVVKFSSNFWTNFLIHYLYFYTSDHTFPLLKISWLFLLFPVCGGEMWHLERDGDPEDQVHGADWLGTKCSGDNTWILFEDLK